jgi:hypothetical protein
MTGADALDGRIDGDRVGRAHASQWRFMGQPSERDHLLDRHREGELGELRDDRDRACETLAADRLERGAGQPDRTRCPA